MSRTLVPTAVLFQLGPLSHFFRLSPQCSDYEMWIYYVLIFIVIGRERWVSGRYDESGSRCHQFYNVSNTLWGATARDGPRRRDTKRICLLWWGQRRYVLSLNIGASQSQRRLKEATGLLLNWTPPYPYPPFQIQYCFCFFPQFTRKILS